MKQSTDQFELMIHDAGESWLIDSFAPRHEAINDLLELLQQVQAKADQRFGPGVVTINEQIIIDQFGRNPERVRAFLQALGSSRSPEMLLMVWRILEGQSIESMHMEYQQEKHFHLQIRITPAQPQASPEEYESTDIDDAALLRHLGIMKMGQAPVFDGFYALHMKP